MYSKDELLSKSISELEDIAQNIGVQLNSADSQDEIVYAILDKQAEVEGNKNPLGTKRKRVRITKKDTDRVYSVKGSDGENFDLKKNKVSAETQPLFNEQPKLIEAEEPVTETEDVTTTAPAPEEEPAPAPKRRGRKHKDLKLAEEAEAAAAAAPATADEINNTASIRNADRHNRRVYNRRR